MGQLETEGGADDGDGEHLQQAIERFDRMIVLQAGDFDLAFDLFQTGAPFPVLGGAGKGGGAGGHGDDVAQRIADQGFGAQLIGSGCMVSGGHALGHHHRIGGHLAGFALEAHLRQELSHQFVAAAQNAFERGPLLADDLAQQEHLPIDDNRESNEQCEAEK